MQARAPSASARKMSAPVRMPPSNITSVSEPTALRDRRQRRDRRRRAVELAPAMVRHDDGVGAELDRGLGVFDVENALDDELARPDFLDPFDVFPVQRRIELLVGPLRQRGDVLHALHVAGEIAEGLAACSCRMLKAQPGLVAMSMMFAQPDFRRHRHAVA